MADVGISFGGDSADARRAAEQIIRELEKVSRQALQTSAVMRTALGGVTKDFGGMTKASITNRQTLERNRTEVDRNTNSFSKFSRQIIVANQALSLMGKAIAVLKFPAMIVAVGYAVQAINALVAGTLALVGALGSLAGLAGAIPGAIITLGTAALTAKLAFNGLKEALNGNEEAFKKLTPEAQKFVRVLNGIKPIIKDFRQSAQQGLFPGLTEGLNSIFNERNVAVISNGLKLMGKAMGDSFAELGKLIGTSGFAKDLDFLLKSAARNFRILGGAAVDIVDAFRNIAVAAQPLVNYITSLISRFGTWIQKATEAGRQSGALAGFFDQTKQTLQELGHILGPVGKALVNIFRIAAPYGHQLLKLLGGAADQLQRVTESTRGQSAIKKYFADAMPVLIEMGRLVRDVVGAFLKIGATPELTNLIKRLRLELLPVLVGIMDSAMRGFAPALVDAAIALAKLVAVVAGASGPLTQFVKFLGGIFKFATWIIQNVPYATKILAALFGIMAVNKVIPITKGIQYLVRQYQLLAVAEVEAGVASTTMSRMFSVSVKAMKAALVSTGIGVALLAIGLAAEYIILHWDKLRGYFKAIFVTLVEEAKWAAYNFLGPFLVAFKGLLKGASFVAGVFDKIFGTHIKNSVESAIDAINTTMATLKPNVDNISTAWANAGDATTRAKGAVDDYALSVGNAAAVTANLAYAWQPGKTPPQVGLSPNITGGALAGRTAVLPEAFQSTHETAGLPGFPAFDVMMKPGTPVGSPADGQIVKISGSAGVRDEKVGIAGYSVYLAAANGDTYFMTHFGSVTVKVGQTVRRGQQLGVVFSWGQRTHIHIGRNTAGTAITPGTASLTSSSAITPSTPDFKTTGASTASQAPTKADVQAVRADVSVFARGTRRVLDPGIRRELAADIKEVRKLLSGPVTKSEMDKATKLFDEMKALYEDGLNLNPIVQKLRYFDSHMGRFASLPKTADAIRQGIRRTRALIAQFTKKGSEGGILITDEEQKQIENSFAKVKTAVARGLERVNLQREFAKFKASMKTVMADAIKSVDPITAGDLQARIQAAMAKYGELMAKGLTGRAKQVLATARDLRRQLVETLAADWGAAKQRVTDALQGIFDNAMEAISNKWQRWLKGQEAAIAAAFGVIRGQTAASRRLQEFRDAREEANIKKAVIAANKELADSELELATLRQQGADPETIKQSEERVQAARDAIAEQKLDAQDRTLQKEADTQEQAYQDALDAAREQADAMAEIERNKFAERFRMIQEAYADEKITAEEAQTQILGLLGEYGIETTEAMGATAVFTKALEELGKAIVRLATVLKNVRELSTPSSSNDDPKGTTTTALPVVPNSPKPPGWIPSARGGFVPRTSTSTIGRDSVQMLLQPGELVLNAAQQANLAGLLAGGGGGGGGSPIVVQINRPLLLGRSLAVADEIAGAVAPAINRRIGYRY